MIWRWWRGNDDLSVVISLAMTVGMIVGAVAALWIVGGEPGRIARGLP